MDRVVRTLKKHNQRFLEPGEELRAGVFGNVGPGALIFLVTDRHVYVLRGRPMLTTRGKKVLAKHVRGQVDVAGKGRDVQVGRQSLVHFDYMRGGRRVAEFAALASQSQSHTSDAEILADLARREGKRWRRRYLIGTVIAAFILYSSLVGLGLEWRLAAVVGIPLTVILLVIGAVSERRDR
jgi:hypothetical protein